MYSRKRVTNNRNIAKIPSLLTQINPDVCYDDWSSKGDKYLGTKDVRSTWNCFKPSHPNPVRIGTLIRMAKQRS